MHRRPHRSAAPRRYNRAWRRRYLQEVVIIGDSAAIDPTLPRVVRPFPAALCEALGRLVVGA